MSPRAWPIGIDWFITLGYLVVIFGLPILGYCILVMDFRRYLRSLRRAMVFVADSVQATVPAWAAREKPGCLTVFDLRLPCTEEDVMAAYREKVKDLHPDRGGNLQDFLRLQKQLEQALHLVRTQARSEAPSRP